MRNKVLVLLIIIGSLFFKVNSIYALDDNVVNSDILNEFSSGMEFTEDNFLISSLNVGGSISVDYFLNNIDEKSLLDMGIISINIRENDMIVDTHELLKYGMFIDFNTLYGEVISYEILFLGDVNSDSVVNDIDIDLMVNDLINYGNVNYVNDINRDGFFDILDVTAVMRAIKSNSWDDLVGIDTVLNNFIDSLDNVYIGDVIEVKFNVSNFNNNFINGISGKLNYDRDYLVFDSISIDSKYGDITSDGKFNYVFDNVSDDSNIITIKFKVIRSGNTTVSFDDIIFASDGVRVYSNSSFVDTVINIQDYGTGGDGFNESKDNDNYLVKEVKKEVVTVSNSNKVDNNYVLPLKSDFNSSIISTTVKLSSDNYIKFLKIKGYDIEFDKEKLEYDITVNSDVSKLDLDIILNDDNSSYEILGNDKFKKGLNIVSIIVTSEDGTNRTYTINVNKESSKVSNNNGSDSKDKSRIVIIVLIILVIIGLIYIIFKDDEEEERK